MAELKDRIATLEEELKQLRTRRRVQDGRRQRLETQQAKKTELRKRLLVGGVVLAKVARGEIAPADLLKWMTAELTRPEDRALFGVPPSDR
jgi:hypothetical protein